MRVIFVADNFADKFNGGAELSIQTHIDTCPFKFEKVRSRDFHKKKFHPKKDFLIFGNFAEIDMNLLPGLAGRPYVVEECDYKYCTFRSSHKHKALTGVECDCHFSVYGKTVVNFLNNALHTFWKSDRQYAEYLRVFGMMKQGTVVGGVFSEADLDFILSLKGTPRDEKFVILRSDSWIKGYYKTLKYCRDNAIPYREIGSMPYRDSLREMAKSRGIIYQPQGFDVSCRMITEAKLLGIEIVTNDLVQHMTEDWFNGTEEEMLAFLRSRNPEFWRIVKELAL